MKSAARTARLAAFALCLAAGAAHGAASPWVENGPSSVRLITPYAVAPATGELRLGVEFRTQPGWHVYWKNSGDAGYAPRVDFAPSPGLAKTELLWPAPNRFELAGGLVAFGYEGEVVYPIRARLVEGAGDPLNHLKLVADVDYLVCQVDCIPYRTQLQLEQPLGPPGAEREDAATAPLIAAGWARLPSPVGKVQGVTAESSLAAGPTADRPTLVVRLQGVEAKPDASLFLEPQESFETGRPEIARDPGGVTFRLPLTATVADHAPTSLALAWTATGLLHAGQPLALEDRQTVALGAPSPTAPDAGQRPANWGRSPRELAAAGAVASLLLALWLWGLFRGASPGASTPRGALGFLAVAGTFYALYELAHTVRFETLALVELSLLALALLAWLRRRAAHRGALASALTVALAACALAALFLARLSG